MLDKLGKVKQAVQEVAIREQAAAELKKFGEKQVTIYPTVVIVVAVSVIAGMVITHRITPPAVVINHWNRTY